MSASAHNNGDGTFSTDVGTFTIGTVRMTECPFCAAGIPLSDDPAFHTSNTDPRPESLRRRCRIHKEPTMANDLPPRRKEHLGTMAPELLRGTDPIVPPYTAPRAWGASQASLRERIEIVAAQVVEDLGGAGLSTASWRKAEDLVKSRMRLLAAEVLPFVLVGAPALSAGSAVSAAAEGIHFDDPRYKHFLAAYNVIVDATPVPLRAVMEPSAGTLAARIVKVLFPAEAQRKCPACGGRGGECSHCCNGSVAT